MNNDMIGKYVYNTSDNRFPNQGEEIIYQGNHGFCYGVYKGRSDLGRSLVGRVLTKDKDIDLFEIWAYPNGKKYQIILN